VVIIKSQFSGNLVAEFDQSDNIGSNGRGNLFGRFPRFLAFYRVVFGFQDFADVVIGDLFAVDLTAEGTKFLLNFGIQLDNLFHKVFIHLVGQIGAM